MPFYYVEIAKTSGERASGIKELPDTDIEKVWDKLYRQAKAKFGDTLFHFDCMQVSRKSPLMITPQDTSRPVYNPKEMGKR